MREVEKFPYRTIKEISNLVFGFKKRRMVESAERQNSWVLVNIDNGKEGKDPNWYPTKIKIRNF